MHLILLSDFLQVLYSARKLPSKDLYFYKHTLFSAIYLLPDYKLNNRNYFKQEIIMNIFYELLTMR
jgi:hypothetical protein